MKRLLPCVLVVVFEAVAALAAGDPTYVALRAARPDGRTVALTNFVFDRDVYHVTLDGTLHLLAPVGGKSVGAVFVGRGSYELTPASEVERRLLAVVADQKELKTFRDDFDSMVVFDAELVAKAGAPAAGSVSPEAAAKFDRFLQVERRELFTNLHLRVLQAMLNGEPSAPFIAYVSGKKTPAILAVDARGAESLRLGREMGGEETILYSSDQKRYGFWYSSHLRGETPHAAEPVARATHYTVTTTLKTNDELSGVTTIAFVNGSRATRLLPVELFSRLRIDEASFAPSEDAKQWTPLVAIQEAAKEDGDAAVVFPTALQPGQTLALRIAYHGREVLENAGDGNFYVNARSSWYPNLGTGTTRAPFDLSYRMPQALQVVSVGEPLSDSVEGTERIATFRTAQPIRAAGFNYGKFTKTSKTDPESGLTVEVFANAGIPDAINGINHALKAAQTRAENSNVFNPGTVTVFTGPDHISLDPKGLVDGVIADSFNTARLGKLFFGALPQKRIAVTQQTQWAFGQSWPQLIYMPYMAVLSPAGRAQLGLMAASPFVNQVGPHELAHQWWGHNVSPATYHDTWLSEGFAEFTSALVVQLTGGNTKYNDFWEATRKSIVERPAGAFVDSADVGPLTEGRRLSTWRNRDAYEGLVYGKGAYVLQMIRTLMQDRNKQPMDADFMAAMTDFATTYAGKNATTEDFKHVLERHIVPNLDGAGDGKLDWFFDQWVYGTEIPRLSSALKAEETAGGKIRISGTITQAEVSEGFKTLVPVYAEFDKGQIARLAVVPMIGSATRPLDVELPLPKKPRAVRVNAMHDVLSR